MEEAPNIGKAGKMIEAKELQFMWNSLTPWEPPKRASLPKSP